MTCLGYLHYSRVGAGTMISDKCKVRDPSSREDRGRSSLPVIRNEPRRPRAPRICSTNGEGRGEAQASACCMQPMQRAGAMPADSGNGGMGNGGREREEKIQPDGAAELLDSTHRQARQTRQTRHARPPSPLLPSPRAGVKKPAAAPPPNAQTRVPADTRRSSRHYRSHCCCVERGRATRSVQDSEL